MKKIYLLLTFLFFNFSHAQCWKQIESGANHTIAIHIDGTLWAWGSNSMGEVGDGTSTGKSIPTLIDSSTNWVSISAGHSHSLALKSNGTIWSWGFNVHNALGLGGIVQAYVPTQIGSNADWAYISAGHSNSFAIKTNGTLWGWGINLYGEVGDGSTTPKTTPTQVGTSTNWKKVSSGNSFTAAIKTNGTLWTWGTFNNFGELGTGNYTSHFTPFQIGTDTNWSMVSTESTHGVALKTNGTIWSWGDNTSGQLGLGLTTSFLSPTQIGNDNDWKYVETGNWKSYFIKNNGTLWATGEAFLGNGTSNSSNVLIQVGIDNNWKTVSSQLFQTIGLKTTQIGYGWGSNYFGQIGNGYFDTGFDPDPNDYSSPVQINCPCVSSITPVFSFNQIICSGVVAPILPTISDNGISGTWSPSIVSNTESANYTFIPNTVLFPCATSLNTYITVKPIESIVFNSIPSSLCQFSNSVNLPTSSDNLISISGSWSPSQIDTTIVGTFLYTFTPNTNECTNLSYQAYITIESSIYSNFDEIPPLCSGDSIPVLSNTAPNGVVGTWFPSTIDNSSSGNYVFTPSASGCIKTQTLNVTILPLTNPDFSDIIVCKNEETQMLQPISPNGIYGVWSPSVIDYNDNGTYVFTPNIGQCANSQTISVTVQESLIVDVSYSVSDYFSDNSIISINVLPVSDYLYQLDDGLYQESPLFENIPSGIHTITILENNGCKKLIQIENIKIVDFPKYFTPNNDGFNDYWNIANIGDANLYIYDRFGKLLKQINTLGIGWDGNYLGNKMPSDDYWFKVEYYENGVIKSFNSHFSLKR